MKADLGANTIMEITARNINQAFYRGMINMLTLSKQRPECVRDSRNGRVLKYPKPWMTTYQNPLERVLMYPERKSNPFFHFFEGLWMIAGRDDVKFLSQFVPRMRTFSDDGITYHSAYGKRIADQIPTAVKMLKKDPTTRQCVLQIWDKTKDLDMNSKDLPCNNLVYLSIEDGELNMTVCNRSNDMMWGAYGANVVHFSMIQEYIAGKVGVEVGEYTQFSNNMHVYLDSGPFPGFLERSNIDFKDYYGVMIDDPSNGTKVNLAEPYPMFEPGCGTKDWEDDLFYFFHIFDISEDANYYVNTNNLVTPFFREVVAPMWNSFISRGEPDVIDDIQASDWRLAVKQFYNIGS